MLFLMPSDPLAPRRVDPHFGAQAAAARAAAFAVAPVDHDALTQPGRAAEAVRGVPESADAVYRGWMLTGLQYQAFADALQPRGVRLRTPPAEFRTAHELPGWYAALREVTPESAWTTGPDLDQLTAIAAGLGDGPAVLRDYVKSMKHYWHQATFVPDLADRNGLRRVAERFLELREDDFAGGFVLRRFEEFSGTEVRTWWIDGHCALTTAHPDSPGTVAAAEADLDRIEPLVAGLALPFVTVDLVRRADGAWRVVELGDGQVSDWPAGADPAELVGALSAARRP